VLESRAVTVATRYWLLPAIGGRVLINNASMRLGPLERRVLEALWRRASFACVRDLQSAFPDIAYTTLMTTLERLYRKGVLDRVFKRPAFSYRPRLTRAEAAFSFMLDEIGTVDEATLTELERLVRARRRALKERA
jgi:predicted transcriptional regulator